MWIQLGLLVVIALLVLAFSQGWWPFEGMCLPGAMFHGFCSQESRDRARNQRVIDIQRGYDAV